MKTFKILLKTDLRDKILISLLLIILFRILSNLPVPFTNIETISLLGQEDIFGLINTFSGGALRNFTIMATGVSSYISASIVIQLLSYFIPAVHRMVRSPGGDKKVKRITIVLGIISALITSFITTKTMNSFYGLLTNDSWYVYLIIAILHATGTGIAILIGETITEKGFGNGMSLLVCINVLSSIPSSISMIKESKSFGYVSNIAIITMIIIFSSVILLTIIAETSERKIPLFYPKVAARGQLPKENMFFPVKVNLSGVMPIIFASYIVQFISFFGKMNNKIGYFINNMLDSTSIHYVILFSLLVFIFSFLYAIISFDSKEVSENIQKNGAIIPSIKPGKETAEYLVNVRKNITKINAIYLTIIYLIPTLILNILGLNYFTSSSIIILVGVAIETCKSLKVEIELRDFKTL